jgi:hypothetical protein
MLACMRHSQVSCTPEHDAHPAPYRWKASTGSSARRDRAPTDRPAASSHPAQPAEPFTDVSLGSESQRARFAVSASRRPQRRVRPPAVVGCTASSIGAGAGVGARRVEQHGQYSATGEPA